MFKKILSLNVIVCFFLTNLGPLPKAHADTLLGLPTPGTIINLSPAYQPVMIKGLTVHKDNPFLFDFIVDVGQDRMSGEPLKKEGEKLIKYFLASLAIPDKDVWVNLSPYEKNRMIPEALGQTDMGRDLLEQDYILKQITASLIYPEKDLGKEFWNRVYSKAQEMYGTTQVPVNTFNKVWIMADRAEVFERNQTAFVVDSHLKVMLEEDYLALEKNQRRPGLNVKAPQGNNPHALASQIVKQIILPQLEKEVNTGKNFANLRQIVNSLILANWYKNNLKQALLNQFYTDQNKVKGIDLKDPNVKQKIYEQYLKAYKKGVFNYIKEEVTTQGGSIPRKYFSGGFVENEAVEKPTVIDSPEILNAAMATDKDPLMKFTTGIATGAATTANAAMSSEDFLNKSPEGRNVFLAGNDNKEEILALYQELQGQIGQVAPEILDQALDQVFGRLEQFVHNIKYDLLFTGRTEPDAEVFMNLVAGEMKKVNQKYRILIADDKPNLLSSYKGWLEEEGYQIETAENGEIALGKIKSKNPGYYSLVLSDDDMPYMDGFPLAYSLWQEPSLRKIPIVIHTSGGTRSLIKLNQHHNLGNIKGIYNKEGQDAVYRIIDDQKLKGNLHPIDAAMKAKTVKREYDDTLSIEVEKKFQFGNEGMTPVTVTFTRTNSARPPMQGVFRRPMTESPAATAQVVLDAMHKAGVDLSAKPDRFYDLPKIILSRTFIGGEDAAMASPIVARYNDGLEISDALVKAFDEKVGNLTFTGRPTAGKGTASELIDRMDARLPEGRKIEKIVLGDYFRGIARVHFHLKGAEDQYRKYEGLLTNEDYQEMKDGKLVNDTATVRLFREIVKEPRIVNAAHIFTDGFPRNMVQWELVKRGGILIGGEESRPLEFNLFLDVEIPKDVTFERAAQRIKEAEKKNEAPRGDDLKMVERQDDYDRFTLPMVIDMEQHKAGQFRRVNSYYPELSDDKSKLETKAQIIKTLHAFLNVPVNAAMVGTAEAQGYTVRVSRHGDKISVEFEHEGGATVTREGHWPQAEGSDETEIAQFILSRAEREIYREEVSKQMGEKENLGEEDFRRVMEDVSVDDDAMMADATMNGHKFPASWAVNSLNTLDFDLELGLKASNTSAQPAEYTFSIWHNALPTKSSGIGMLLLLRNGVISEIDRYLTDSGITGVKFSKMVSDAPLHSSLDIPVTMSWEGSPVSRKDLLEKIRLWTLMKAASITGTVELGGQKYSKDQIRQAIYLMSTNHLAYPIIGSTNLMAPYNYGVQVARTEYMTASIMEALLDRLGISHTRVAGYIVAYYKDRPNNHSNLRQLAQNLDIWLNAQSNIITSPAANAAMTAHDAETLRIISRKWYRGDYTPIEDLLKDSLILRLILRENPGREEFLFKTVYGNVVLALENARSNDLEMRGRIASELQSLKDTYRRNVQQATESRRTTEFAFTDQAMAGKITPGGIDLNTSNGMQWKVSKDGNGVEMTVDPAMIERIRHIGINSLSPVIFTITPVASIWPLVGLQAPVQAETLAGV